jgi:autotransporter-associated beta strand protein
MRFFKILGFVLLALLPPVSAIALQTTPYTAAGNNRFETGFPTSPVENSSGTFVGRGFDWSGVGWSSSDGTKGFGFLSPQHYLVASHYGGATTVNLNSLAAGIVSGNELSVENTGYGLLLNGQPDISLGTLSSSIPDSHQIARYAVLDLNPTSSTNASYNGLSIFLYGRGPNGSSSPRIGTAVINSTTNSGTGTFITTDRVTVQLEGGDSGSPAVHGWTNPNGSKELTLLGLNTGVNATSNFISFLGTSGAMAALNTLMNDDGFALRVAGNSTNTWVGSSNTAIGNRNSWGLSPPATAPSDVYVSFNGSTAGNSRVVTIDTSHNLRGLYFLSTAASGDGFAFNGSSALTIGRGGVTNYDNSRQVFNAPITLGSAQYWDGGSGGITVTNLNTNGRLLEITGDGINRINGIISGTGSLALGSGRLELLGNSTYTGKTWVHSGTLRVDGNIASSSQLALGAEGRLLGTGVVSLITGSGAVDPGNSAGILTALSVNPSAGLDFNFEFSLLGSPNYSDASASGNDLLRLTGGNPFAAPLSASNTISIFLNVANLSYNDTFRGGFFTDVSVTFLSNIEDATFLFYLSDIDGSVLYNQQNYRLYSGPLSFQIGTVSELAAFASGTVNGRIFETTVIPEAQETALMITGCLILIAFVLRSTRRSRAGAPD